MSKIKYIHLRRYHPATIDPETGAPREATLNSKGGKTIAYVIDDDYKVLGYASANCHANDVYNKRIGRVKAAGRLKSQNYFKGVQANLEEPVFVRGMIDSYYLG